MAARHMARTRDDDAAERLDAPRRRPTHMRPAHMRGVAVPAPEPEPEPAPEPEPEPAPEPTLVLAPVPGPEPEPTLASEPAPVPTPMPMPEPTPAPAAESLEATLVLDRVVMGGASRALEAELAEEATDERLAKSEHAERLKVSTRVDLEQTGERPRMSFFEAIGAFVVRLLHLDER